MIVHNMTNAINAVINVLCFNDFVFFKRKIFKINKKRNSQNKLTQQQVDVV